MQAAMEMAAEDAVATILPGYQIHFLKADTEGLFSLALRGRCRS
jgi:hypothetical protein